MLGKLGGKNRQFLREPLRLPSSSVDESDAVTFPCRWAGNEGVSDSQRTPRAFGLLVPLSRCKELLQHISTVPTPNLEKSENIGDACPDRHVIAWKDCDQLWDCRMEKVDYDAYAVNVMDETKAAQAVACVQVISAAISTLGGLQEIDSNSDASTIHETRLNELHRSESEIKIKSVLAGKCLKFFWLISLPLFD